MKCKYCGGETKHRDYANRTIRLPGWQKEVIEVERVICKDCGRIQRVDVDGIGFRKRYSDEVRRDVIDGIVTEDDLEYEDYPCAMTMKRWKSQENPGS